MKDTGKIRELQVVALILAVVMLVHFAGEYTFDAYKAEALEPYSIDTCSEEEMFRRYIGTLMEEKLYTSRDAYDAAHYLMVPMYYAFQSEKKEYIEMFQKSMERLTSMSSEEKKDFKELSPVDRIQYLYLVSQYIVLCAEYEMPVSEDLFTLLLEEVEKYADSYTGSWESPADYQNFWELLEGLMDGEGYGNGKSYEHVITGNDLKILAMLCDLKYVLEKSQLNVTCDEESLERAVTYANRIMESYVTWYEDGSWQFQVGAWCDYPDYQFAGIDAPEKIEEGVDYRVKDIVWDSNHFMRFPLLLRSYQRVQSSQEKWDFYDSLIKGVGKTLVEKVLVAPDAECSWYRMTNYMDGGNGLYRYGYHEDKVGYLPYQQSSEYLLGWWAFCNSSEISESYRYTAEQMPLDEAGREIYTDPVTVREQNPIFLMENYEQFLCYLAGKLTF